MKYLIALINMPSFKHFGIVALMFLIGKVVSWLITVATIKYNWDGGFVSFFNDAHSAGIFVSTLWTFILGLIGLLILILIRWVILDLIAEYKTELKKIELVGKGEIK